MTSSKRLYPALITLAVCILIALWLGLGHLDMRRTDREWPPRHHSDITMEEEFAEIIDLPMSPAPAQDNPAPVPLPEPAEGQAEPAPESGHHVDDAGIPAEAPATTASSKEELEQQRREEEARRRATANTQNAFRNATGNAAAASTGKKPGQGGAPSDVASALNGRGSGSAGGGWIIPAYAKVPSSVTGSVKMRLTIDRTGRVTSVTFQGGDAPAATDAAVRRAVEAEVRARRFTRHDDNAPEESTAYITYTFK